MVSYEFTWFPSSWIILENVKIVFSGGRILESKTLEKREKLNWTDKLSSIEWISTTLACVGVLCRTGKQLFRQFWVFPVGVYSRSNRSWSERALGCPWYNTLWRHLCHPGFWGKPTLLAPKRRITLNKLLLKLENIDYFLKFSVVFRFFHQKPSPRSLSWKAHLGNLGN